ncbi:MAG: UDP-N-acetylmuramate dehydrogenase [Thermogutta sp.]
MAIWSGFERVVRQAEVLAMHTWLGLGGPAQFYAEPRTPEELAGLILRAKEEGVPVRVLGAGSNILVRDEGVSGLVVHLGCPAFMDMRSQDNRVIVGGGASLTRVVTFAAHEGFGGLETLVAIPGTVGGAVRGNVGTHSGDIGEWVRRVEVVTLSGAMETRTHREILFSRRKSTLDDAVIVEVELELTPEDPVDLTRRLHKLWILRKAGQPLGHQNSARLFKDPRGASACELIEAAGLKGTQVGGATLCDRNVNFVVAEAHCSANDIVRIIDTVRTQVQNRLGVQLELDLEIW